MNGEICCILGVCCPAASDEQTTALAKEMVTDLKCDPQEAYEIAGWVFKHFDLAPAGSLTPYREAILKLAKHAKP